MATRVLKTCGHYCYPSTLGKCCACEDIRPISSTGFYERYIDGEGWTTTAARDDGYCPVCNTKNYDKWMKRVKEQTEKKKREEEEKNQEEYRKQKLLEQDRKRMDTTGDDKLQHNITIQYTNGDLYVGDVVRGQPHGQGRMDYADNDDDILFYEGGWKEGKHAGLGKKVWMDDTWYEGSWQDGMMHGQGTYHVNLVDVMIGRFEEDVFQD